jgi:predicted ATP-dependent serine protease
MHVKRRAIPKVTTQIAGLDEILEGGLPRGRTSLVSGGPGSGKTVLSLEFLCRGAMAGPRVFVTFEGSRAVRQRDPWGGTWRPWKADEWPSLRLGSPG